MRKFDTKVQYLKYKVLREVARQAWNDTLLDNVMSIPRELAPRNAETIYCCVYKERAILSERVRMAMGGNKQNPNVIEVIDIACDECPMGGYEVTNSCRGCLARRCEDACPKGAITFHNHVAHIDKSKCKECGACAKVCPYSAIHNYRRPCESACKIKAISMGDEKQASIDNSKCISCDACKIKAITMNENKAAAIDNNTCISCGACVYQCPFGAITDKSYILNVIDMIKKSGDNEKYHVYAVIAPSISSQFTYAKLGQVVTGLHRLGFYSVAEAALGADMVADAESRELVEKGFLTSSCCPGFVSYIEKAFPELKPYISHNLSPMATIARYLKEHDATAKVVFIGPCTAKKGEAAKQEVRPYVDAAMTFEELQALFDSREIDITALEEGMLDEASYFGRIFARCGGLAEAVAQGIKEHGHTDFELKATSCDGIEQCRIALFKKSKKLLDANFIEGMACTGGCIGGAGCLTHGPRSRAEVDKYGMEANDKTITEALAALEPKP